jgi:hypothetical protein
MSHVSPCFSVRKYCALFICWCGEFEGEGEDVMSIFIDLSVNLLTLNDHRIGAV